MGIGGSARSGGGENKPSNDGVSGLVRVEGNGGNGSSSAEDGRPEVFEDEEADREV